MNRPADKMTAVILCGGRSRRMGEDKAELMLDGRTILQRLTENLAPLGDVRLSVREAGDYPDVPLPKVADRFQNCGPMGGLEAALSADSSELLFVTAVDMPFADHVLAEELRAMMEKEPDTDALLMTDGTGRQQFLLGIYRRRVQPVLRSHLIDGSRDALRMRSLLLELRVRFVPAEAVTDGERKTRSFNTGEEFRAFLAKAGAGAQPEAQ